MKEGDLILDSDNRVGVIICVLEPIVRAFDGDPDEVKAALAYFFDTNKEEIIFKADIDIIGEGNGAYILE